MKYNNIIHDNSLDVMENFKKNKIKFDLILTDPPYNIGKDFGNNSDKQEQEEYFKFIYQFNILAKDLLNNNGSLIQFNAHQNIGYIQYYCNKIGLFYKRLMIWHYENGSSMQLKTPVGEFEPFIWFGKSENHTYNIDDIRVSYKTERVNKPIRKKRKDGTYYEWIANPKGKKRGDIWKYDTLAGTKNINEKTEHPTQKPENLITDLIKAFCPKNEDGVYDGYILDPFIGSGTLGVCCEKLNKQGNKIKWLGIELEQKWVEIGRQRIKNIP